MSELRRIREAKGLSQLELSLRTGVSQSTICTYEIGTRGMTLKTLRRLAEGLGVEPRDLLDKGTKMNLSDMLELLDETILQEAPPEIALSLRLQLKGLVETYESFERLNVKNGEQKDTNNANGE